MFNHINESDCEFCNWHYMTIFFHFTLSNDLIEMICFNSECIMSLINRHFLQQHWSDLTIQKLISKIIIWDIESKTHKCQKFVQLDLYLSECLTSNRKLTVTHLTHDVHFVNNLQTNLLVDMNIIESEWISINISSCKTILRECKNMLLNMHIISQNHSHTKWVIWASVRTVISSLSV